jgi:hypothetical protein
MDRTKLQHHIKHLEERHTLLDKKIKDGYSHYLTDGGLQKIKFEKAAVKRELEESKNKLKSLV